MPILRAEDYRRMPWKNGGGVTTEIAVSPEAAGLDDFDWRISMARVETGGPFSAFAGIDRTLSILEGEGLRLTVGDAGPVELRQGSEPHAFPADVPTSAELIGGPVTDLNVMTRRGRYSHSVRRVGLDLETEIAASANETLLFCKSGVLTARAGETSAVLGAQDTLVFSGESLLLTARRPAILFLIELHRH
jgi:environmental stress-induced protein Ves